MTLIIAVVVMSVVATLTIPSEGGKSRFDVNRLEGPTVLGVCPPEVPADFDVFIDGEDSSTVRGCASLEFRSNEKSALVKVFSAMFGYLDDSGPRFCMTGNHAGMEQLLFSCRKHSSSSSINTNNGIVVYKLNGHIVKPAGKHETRCALYKMVNSTMYAIAVSGNSSCNGLHSLLFDIHPKFPKGSMLLELNRCENNLRTRDLTLDDRSTTLQNY